VSGEEYVEVVKRNSAGVYTNYRVLANKLRAAATAYDFAVSNGFIGTLQQWLDCTHALYARNSSMYGKVLMADQQGVGRWTTVDIAIVEGLQEELDSVLLQVYTSAAAAQASAGAANTSAAQAAGAVTGANAARDSALIAASQASGDAQRTEELAEEVATDRTIVVNAHTAVVAAAATVEAAKNLTVQSKDEAEASAAAALLSEQHAGTSAGAAATAAGQAVAAKDTTVTLAADVQTALGQTVTARNAAQGFSSTAQTAAQQAGEARDSAEAFAANAANTVGDLEGLVTDATTAKDGAEAALQLTVAAKDATEVIAAAAVVTKGEVEAAAAEAVVSKDAAGASALESLTARDASEAFAIDSLSARTEAQAAALLASTAKEATDLAVTSTQTAALQAVTARDASEAFAVDALESLTTTQTLTLQAQQAAVEAIEGAATVDAAAASADTSATRAETAQTAAEQAEINAKATEDLVLASTQQAAGYRDQSLDARDDAEANAITAVAASAEANASKLLAQAAVPAAADAAQAEVNAFKQLLIATGVTPGASVVTTIQGGDNAVSRFIQDKLLEQAVSIDDFKLPAEGSNIRPALLRAIEALRENKTKSRVLLIPFTVGEWTVDSQVLFDISDFTLFHHGNVRLTATTRQKTFVFASDTINVPAVALKNVTVFGNGAYINGNADQMTFTYAHGDGSDNDSAVRFSYIDNLRVYNVWADNGPIDSFSTMRCRNQIIDGCKFTRAKEDNGFSATTDWGPVWEYGNFDTYSYGVVSNCTAEDNQDFGMTAYNASGIYFLNNRSQRNRAGYSYEDSFGAPDTKKYDGGFYGCWAWNCREQGFYIDADGITIDPNCKSWNIRYIGSNPNGLFGNGVVIANVGTARVEGEHTACGHAGLAIFNGTGNLIRVHAKGKFNDNDASGIFGRGVSFLHLEPGTEVRNNGKVQVNAQYNYGVNISNSGGANYLQNAGLVKVDGAIIGGNGLGAIDVNYVNLVDIHNVIGVDNAQSGSGLGIRVQNAVTARIFDNHMESVTGNQTFVVDIEATVQNGYEGGNTGTGTTSLVVNNATVKRQSMRAQLYGSFTYDAPSIAAGSQVAPSFAILGAEVGDFVQVSFSADVGLIAVNAFVVTTGNVLVYLRNNTASAIDLPSMSVRVLVTKRNGG
jgi:hypothetical protein